jgi:hypothetical protein
MHLCTYAPMHLCTYAPMHYPLCRLNCLSHVPIPLILTFTLPPSTPQQQVHRRQVRAALVDVRMYCSFDVLDVLRTTPQTRARCLPTVVPGSQGPRGRAVLPCRQKTIFPPSRLGLRPSRKAPILAYKHTTIPPYHHTTIPPYQNKSFHFFLSKP